MKLIWLFIVIIFGIISLILEQLINYLVPVGYCVSDWWLEQRMKL